MPPRCTSNDLLSPVKSHLQKFLPPPNADIQLRTSRRWIQWWNQSLYDSIALPKPHLWTCYIRDQDSSTGGFRGIILYPNYDRIEKGRQQGSLTTPGVNLGPGWFESREPSSPVSDMSWQSPKAWLGIWLCYAEPCSELPVTHCSVLDPPSLDGDVTTRVKSERGQSPTPTPTPCHSLQLYKLYPLAQVQGLCMDELAQWVGTNYKWTAAAL